MAAGTASILEAPGSTSSANSKYLYRHRWSSGSLHRYKGTTVLPGAAIVYTFASSGRVSVQIT